MNSILASFKLDIDADSVEGLEMESMTITGIKVSRTSDFNMRSGAETNADYSKGRKSTEDVSGNGKLNGGVKITFGELNVKGLSFETAVTGNCNASFNEKTDREDPKPEVTDNEEDLK